MTFVIECCRLLRKELEAQELAKAKSRQLAESVSDGCGHVEGVTKMSRMEVPTDYSEKKCARETRIALVQQLTELEALEVKQNRLVS